MLPRKALCALMVPPGESNVESCTVIISATHLTCGHKNQQCLLHPHKKLSRGAVRSEQVGDLHGGRWLDKVLEWERGAWEGEKYYTLHTTHYALCSALYCILTIPYTHYTLHPLYTHQITVRPRL
jgi:hypothetical protein